jgi:hypothetical protein
VADLLQTCDGNLESEVLTGIDLGYMVVALNRLTKGIRRLSETGEPW